MTKQQRKKVKNLLVKYREIISTRSQHWTNRPCRFPNKYMREPIYPPSSLLTFRVNW